MPRWWVNTVNATYPGIRRAIPPPGPDLRLGGPDDPLPLIRGLSPEASRRANLLLCRGSGIRVQPGRDEEFDQLRADCFGVWDRSRAYAVAVLTLLQARAQLTCSAEGVPPACGDFARRLRVSGTVVARWTSGLVRHSPRGDGPGLLACRRPVPAPAKKSAPGPAAYRRAYAAARRTGGISGGAVGGRVPCPGDRVLEVGTVSSSRATASLNQLDSWSS